MFKKYLTLIVTILIVNLALSSSILANDIEKENKFAEKVKINIAKLGTGTDARIEVKLKDGTKLKGYVSEIAEDHFSVTDSKTGKATAVDYHKAKQVKGNNLSTGVKVAIGAVIVFVVFVIIGLAQ